MDKGRNGRRLSSKCVGRRVRLLSGMDGGWGMVNEYMTSDGLSVAPGGVASVYHQEVWPVMVEV